MLLNILIKIKHIYIQIINFRLKPFAQKKDYSLNSGERQTGTTLEQIRRDHINRYSLAINIIKQQFNNSKLNGLDVFCGNGYGSYLLSKELDNIKIVSIDGSKDAIKFAKKYYQNPKITYLHKLFPFKLKKKYDFIISLESIEHIKNDDGFLKQIYSSLNKNGLLIISTPNEEKYSNATNQNSFHYRHYKKPAFIKLLKDNMFSVAKIYGQDCYIMDKTGKSIGCLPENQMDIIEDYDGQFLIYIVHKN